MGGPAKLVCCAHISECRSRMWTLTLAISSFTCSQLKTQPNNIQWSRKSKCLSHVFKKDSRTLSSLKLTDFTRLPWYTKKVAMQVSLWFIIFVYHIFIINKRVTNWKLMLNLLILFSTCSNSWPSFPSKLIIASFITPGLCITFSLKY